MRDFQCLHQESPGKTNTCWFHLLALGDARREGNPGDENGVLESFLECQLAELQTSPHSLLPGPPLHNGELQQEAECGCLPSLRFPGRSTLAPAKSTCCVCCHDLVDRSFSLSGPQHPQLRKVPSSSGILGAFFSWQMVFLALSRIIPVPCLWMFSNRTP